MNYNNYTNTELKSLVKKQIPHFDFDKYLTKRKWYTEIGRKAFVRRQLLAILLKQNI